jgi:hypothetical protein
MADIATTPAMPPFLDTGGGAELQLSSYCIANRQLTRKELSKRSQDTGFIMSGSVH